MGLTIETVRFGADEVFSGYAAYPDRAALPLPAIVVIQEAWGVDTHIEDVTRRFAQAGYVALAPDLFARAGVRPDALSRERVANFLAFFNALPPGTWTDPQKRDLALAALPNDQQAPLAETMAAAFTGASNDAYLEPVLAAASFLRDTYPASRGKKVGTVGFCMGGRLSARAACADPQLAGAIICYGLSPPVELVEKIACPMLGLYGQTDKRVNDTVPAFQQAAKAHGKKLECFFFDGAGHAFFNDTRPSYHVRAAREAFVEMLAFFDANLS